VIPSIFRAWEVNSEAPLRSASHGGRPTRYLAYGDSITHGFTASAVDKSYAFSGGAERTAGRSSISGWADVLPMFPTPRLVTSLKADVISVFMGVNDWQGGGPLERYRSNMMAFL